MIEVAAAFRTGPRSVLGFTRGPPGAFSGLDDFPPHPPEGLVAMIRKLKSGEFRLYSRKIEPKTGKRRNLGTFCSRAAAEKHEKEIQYFKRH